MKKKGGLSNKKKRDLGHLEGGGLKTGEVDILSKSGQKLSKIWEDGVYNRKKRKRRSVICVQHHYVTSIYQI